MGKYIDAGYSPGTFGPGEVVCDNARATAWDAWSEQCFPIFGLGIIIGDTTAPIQAGFEIFNLNVHMDGTQRPVVNPLQLAAPIRV